MEPAIQVLTSLRLADIQCTTWGHPVSSGFKHIDYFFSSELMEKNDSQKNYSEKLIKLPNLAIDFDLPNLSTTQTSKNIKKTNKIIFLNLQVYLNFYLVMIIYILILLKKLITVSFGL